VRNNLPFRPDIEGLRALAVLAVIAFHHQWGLFSGGFIGVDVFFVISGYLITRNILSESRSGRFSFKAFYMRRARRLLPALFFTVAVTLLVGYFVSTPADLMLIAESSMASIFSVSNLYFWMQSGYFDVAANQKPLLHTWSLSVEEQFYLVWPLLVVFLSRNAQSPRIAVALMSVLGVISVWAAERWLSTDSAGAFFLTPFRINEFVLGAICAWIPLRSHRGRLEGEVFSVIALGMIVYPMYSYTDATAFPGISALLPSLGAAMLILFNGGGASRWILTNPVATGIGRISYSLYLAHWPIFVFYRQWKGSEFSLQDTVLVSIASLVLAVFMYKFIEQPFRSRGTLHDVTITTRIFARIYVSVCAGLVVVSVAILLSNGFAWRYQSDLVHFVQETDAERKERFKPYLMRCRMKNALSCDVPTERSNIVILGDSHAPDIFNALIEQYPKLHYVFHGGGGGCPPLTREDYNLLTVKHPNRDSCIANNEKLLYGDQLVRADLVVINTVFLWYMPEHLTHAIVQIRKATNAPIVVLGNYMVFDDDLPDLVVKHGVTTMDEYYVDRLSENTFAYEEELESLSKILGFTYISKRKLFCGNDSVMSCPIIFDGKLFTYDRHHLSLAAAKHLGYEIDKYYGSIFRGLDLKSTAWQIK